jgi:predicted alpha/beta superfamily hydrolase
MLVNLAVCIVLGGCGEQAAPQPTAGPTVQVIEPPLTIPGLGRTRHLRIYLPPSYAQSDARRYPVIYLFDGQNLFDDATAYAGEWGVDESMDALARSHGFEAIVVGIDHGGEQRMTELSAWTNPDFGSAEGELFMQFVVQVAMPYVDGHFRTQTDAAATAVMGSSMGGLAAHYAVHEYPQEFGKAGVFSPSYWYAPAATGWTQEHPLPATTRVFMYAGGAEGDQMVDGARQMHALLRGQRPDGNQLQLDVVDAAGHNEAAWRAEFPKALIWLFDLHAASGPQTDAERSSPASTDESGVNHEH